MTQTDTITLKVMDTSGQREFEVHDIPRTASWGEAMRSIVSSISLPENGSNGIENVIIWSGLHAREGRNLHTSEIVGDTLEDGDTVTMHPHIQAG